MTEHVFPCPNLAIGQPCAPCEDLPAINQEIFEAESVLAALNTKRTLFYGRMNHTHDPLTSKLPVELVSKIFMNFLPDTVAPKYGPYGIYIRGNERVVARTTPLVLGAVCTTWRAITWSTPLLWTSIMVELADLKKANVDILEGWLHRSGGLPLYIGICGMMGYSMPSIRGAVERVMDSFARYAHRWFYLEFASTPPDFLGYLPSNLARALMLNTLKIKVIGITEGIDLGMIPNLRNLVMDYLRIDMLLNMDWEKLTNIEVSIPSIDMCYDLFSKAPSLTHCTLDLYPSGGNIRTTWNTILQYNRLIFLHIKNWRRPTAIVLSLMQFPALQYLVVDSSANLENIISLLRRSHCSLKTLEVDMSLKEMEFELHLIPFLAEIPSLEILEFRHRYATIGNSVNPLLTWLSTTAHTQETATGQFGFLPNLRTLRIENMALSYGHVLDVVKAHSDDSTVLTPTRCIEGSETRQHIRPLQSLHIQVWGRKYELIELDIALKLQRAVKDGFNITIVADGADRDNHCLADVLDKSLHPYEA